MALHVDGASMYLCFLILGLFPELLSSSPSQHGLLGLMIPYYGPSRGLLRALKGLLAPELLLR